MERVSSSEGGLRKPFAAFNAGVAAIMKPVVVNTKCNENKPEPAHITKRRLGGFGGAAVAN